MEENLACGGFEEVARADDLGDVGLCVVDYVGELVAGKTVFAPDEEVAEVAACGEVLWALVKVYEVDRLVVGDAEAVVGIRLQELEAAKSQVSPLRRVAPPVEMTAVLGLVVD